jgi:Na+-transporting methylmalonyl-CoA/oxaloacetate decarboxylase gamma subunit
MAEKKKKFEEAGDSFLRGYAFLLFGSLIGAMTGGIFSLFFLPFKASDDGTLTYFGRKIPLSLPTDYQTWLAFFLGMSVIFLILFTILIYCFKRLMKIEKQVLPSKKKENGNYVEKFYWGGVLLSIVIIIAEVLIHNLR